MDNRCLIKEIDLQIDMAWHKDVDLKAERLQVDNRLQIARKVVAQREKKLAELDGEISKNAKASTIMDSSVGETSADTEQIWSQAIQHGEAIFERLQASGPAPWVVEGHLPEGYSAKNGRAYRDPKLPLDDLSPGTSSQNDSPFQSRTESLDLAETPVMREVENVGSRQGSGDIVEDIKPSEGLEIRKRAHEARRRQHKKKLHSLKSQDGL